MCHFTENYKYVDVIVLNISEFQHNRFLTLCKVVWLHSYYVVRKNNDFVANFLPNPKVKEILKSSDIWQIYERIIMSLVLF